ncbi:MAG: transcriptional regulator [candidate division Zixibacteria bacterium CG_4_9_14_3_um_filter_46_8]|nr:MAG: transcriptional regulator [candidate division Zixibacteria bacterium CG_4_9_14_3_um_filter_46_8]
METQNNRRNTKMNFELRASDISKSFECLPVLKNITFEVSAGEGLIITGANGSGKSTLIRILSGLNRPTSGEVIFSADGNIVHREDRRLYYSLVSPDMQFYEELSARENMIFFIRIRGMQSPDIEMNEVLGRYGLQGRGNDLVKSYSSGMKQRLKYVVALLSKPEVLFLDEPTSNLDEAGLELVDAICEEQKKRGILVVATNDKRDFKYGEKIIRLSGRGSRSTD